jgi:Tfp pilus assembly protein PilF
VVFQPRRSVLDIVGPIRRAVLPLVAACAAVLLPVVDAFAQNNTSSSWSLFGHSSPSTSTLDSPSDEISLSAQPKAKPGVELYVAVAKLYVQNGKYALAEDQYQEALKRAPNDLSVLLPYAKLKDQIKQPDEAMKLYQHALEKHPKDSSVYNDLAVHYSRWNMDREAIEAEQHAVALRPSEPLYRNNLAAVLVEVGRTREAYQQLRAVYDEPIAHYDLGFLLNKCNMKPGALQEFTIALQLRPGMTLARHWVQRLSLEQSESRAAVLGMAPTPQQALPPPPPNFPREELLPPPPMAPPPPQFIAQPANGFVPQNPGPVPQQAAVQYPGYCPPPVPSPNPGRPQPPAEAYNPVQGPPPVQVQYPAGPQYAGPQIADRRGAPDPAAPQNAVPSDRRGSPDPAAPQNAVVPQFQYPAPPPTGNPSTAVASLNLLPPLVPDSDAPRRLPPVVDVPYPAQADGNPQGPGPEIVSPSPPDWRR